VTYSSNPLHFTSNNTHGISVMKLNLLLMFNKKSIVSSGILLKSVSTLCAQNTEFPNVVQIVPHSTSKVNQLSFTCRAKISQQISQITKLKITTEIINTSENGSCYLSGNISATRYVIKIILNRQILIRTQIPNLIEIRWIVWHKHAYRWIKGHDLSIMNFLHITYAPEGGIFHHATAMSTPNRTFLRI
jgi:hypothetical protein